MLAGEATWDRVAGCLHGLLIGDALGCPVEGWTPEAIVERLGRVSDMCEVRGAKWRPAGLHSDDGQQALATLDAILTDPEHPERPFARLLIELRDAAPQRAGRWGLHRGTGRNFRHTVRGLQATEGREPLGHATASAGNGAAMRMAPVGLWWRDQPEVRDLRAATLAAVTHSDLRGIAAAQAIAAAVARSLVAKPGPVLDDELVAAVTRAEERAATLLELDPDPRFSKLLEALVSHRRSTKVLADLLTGIKDRATAKGGADEPVEATSAFAPCSVLTALLLVDLAEGFEDCLITAVNLGGDTDTIGAMAGAVAGARWGLEAIPPRWLDGLRATGSLFDRIELVVRRDPTPAVPSVVDLEREWDKLFDNKPAFRATLGGRGVSS